MRLYPVTLLLPLVVFGLLCGLGVWGVVAGARSVASNARDEARTKAVDAAAAFQVHRGQQGAGRGSGEGR